MYYTMWIVCKSGTLEIAHVPLEVSIVDVGMFFYKLLGDEFLQAEMLRED